MTSGESRQPFFCQTATAEAGPEGLGLRAAPTPFSPITGRVPDGGLITVLHRFGGWFEVRYNVLEGFVSGDSLVLHY